PALSALSIFATLSAWNNFLWPLIVLHESRMLTLPVGLAMLQGTYSTSSYGVVMSAAVIASAPVLIIYAFFQKKIIQGVSITGVLK
ncbi:MAG TPA: carbohydrate ABC transporter permease, partial [Spirochaetia bacterium]|nr:carbohydrate ABC transporter permease [Spirochaetia bacterium]